MKQNRSRWLFVVILAMVMILTAVASIFNQKVAQTESDPTCVQNIEQHLGYRPRHCTEGDWATDDTETLTNSDYQIVIQKFTGDKRGGYRITYTTKGLYWIQFMLQAHDPHSIGHVPGDVMVLYMYPNSTEYFHKSDAPHGLTIALNTIILTPSRP